MPPKSSKLPRPPSKKAVDVAAASDTSPKRSRRMVPQPSTNGAGASSLSSDPQPQAFLPGAGAGEKTQRRLALFCSESSSEI